MGLILNHGGKTARIVDKTITKVKHLKEHRGNLSLGHFRSLGSLLMYCSLALKRDPGRFQYVLQHWAQVQRRLFFEPSSAKYLWVEPPEITALLVARLEKAPVDFYVITDASGFAYGGIVVSAKSAQCTIVQGTWGPKLKKFCGDSAFAEPLGMFCVLRQFFDRPGAAAVIQHFGDNKGNEAITNKGYSTKPSQIVMELVRRELPGLKIRSEYSEGATLPADRVSRLADPDSGEIHEFFKGKGIDLVVEFGQFLRVLPADAV